MEPKDQELINQIMANVKDEKLRADLLRKIVSEDSGNGSVVMRELEALGFNPAGVKHYANFQFKSQVSNVKNLHGTLLGQLGQ